MDTRFICDHDNLTGSYGRFILEPLSSGAGAVLGNALRRVLLSRLDGAAVTAVKIQSVAHEFAPIPGAVEDTSEVIRNLRLLKLEMSGSAPKKLRASAEGAGVITARDLKADDGVRIMNPGAHIVTLEAGSKFAAEMEVNRGIGFKEADPGGGEIGVIDVDADFCPIERVSYTVKTLEGNAESLSIELYTNGSINPIDAMKKAAEILKSGLTDEGLISSKFNGTSGTFVMSANPGGHTIGSTLRWALMSNLSPDCVRFADYNIQKDGSLSLEVHTDGSMNPKEAISLAAKGVSEMLDIILSPPESKRGCPSIARSTSAGAHTGSVSFGDASSFWLAPNLMDVQRNSYERFLQMGLSPEDREQCGLEKALAETFPIKSNGLILDCLGYSCGKPPRTPDECLELSLTYSVPVTLRMRLSIEEKAGKPEGQKARKADEGESLDYAGKMPAMPVVEEDVIMGEVPLMTADGIFIINGLRRTVIGQLVGLGMNEFSDLARKKVKTVGDFLYEEAAEAFAGIKTIASEQMAVADSHKLTPSSLLCTGDPSEHPHIEPVAVALNKFFVRNPNSQAVQENNVLDKLTHCRRVKQDTCGIPIDRVPMEPRSLHHTSYGRICPLESPEGPNIGLIGTLAMYAHINDKGLIEAPYREVKSKKVSDQIISLSAQDEGGLVIAPASCSLSSKVVPARINGDVQRVDPVEVNCVDFSRQQTLGPSASLIPLLEHNDANRTLMGCNMQRQAVPLLFAEPPLVQSGAESKIALDSGGAVAARRDGVVTSVTAGKIEIAADDGGVDGYDLVKHRRSMAGTWINQKPVVSSGQKVMKDQVIADDSSSKGGILSLGRNIMVAYMPWEGYNFEDAILVSEKLIKEDIFTSVHIQTYQTEIRDTRNGREVLTKQPPGVEESALSLLAPDGIVKVGAWVNSGDIIVGKMTPKATKLSPEDRLLHVLTGQDGRGDANYGDSSFRLPPGTGGRITKVQRLSRSKGDPLPKNVCEIVKVEVTMKRKAKVGDKLTGRHGNKGTISRILPEADMPFLPDGTPIEMVLSPLGVPTRLNPGQILETHLGWAAKTLGVSVISPPFDGPDRSQIKDLLGKAGLPTSGMSKVYDGRTGKPVDTDITVGYQYMLKLIHLVDDKIHARSTGPYSLFTQQPTGGKAHFGGQRFGEMETWALEAYGAAYTLRELLTVKSDDVVGRRRMYESLLEGSDSAPVFMPEALKKLILCLRGVAFDMKAIAKSEEDVISNVDDMVAMSIALASPEKIRDTWSHGAVQAESAVWENHQPTPGGLFCERIFGPVNDYQCRCGKLSGKQHDGKVCPECGVEVGASSMRNERMGHINLAAPVCHGWALAAKPNPIAILLDMNAEDVEKVIHYEGYVVVDAGDTGLQRKQVISEEEYRAKREELGKDAFRAETGAAVIREFLRELDLAEMAESADDPQKKRMAEAFQNSGVRPEWMILECIPVMPPGMRPSRHLEGGGIATLDLNELYTRVIARNNKYRELAAIGGEDTHDAARMIQEAVDSLFGNGRRSEGEGGMLKSLSDLLKGKEGMFRSNLLGKRVDYSGRSVIVVGPDLKLDECGLPESMALELFKPFILHKLLSSGTAHSISGARRMIDSGTAEALKAAREIAGERLVMLNRAPTLHRVGIQAFKPILTKLSAIRLHPLVCMAFNADFDGDQMAVHIPLSAEAQSEARQLMLSHKNVLSSAHGGTIVQPTQDMIVGCYYLTMAGETKRKAKFADIMEVKKGYELGRIGLHDGIKFSVDGAEIDTTVGRALFNEVVPSGLRRFINQQMDKRSLSQLIEECHAALGEDETVRLLNDLDDLGFKYATRFGASIGMDTLKTVPERDQILSDAEAADSDIKKNLAEGKISNEEAASQRLNVWSEATTELGDAAMRSLGADSDSINPVFMMVASGARGRPHQLKNLIGLFGLVANAEDKLFDVPVVSNYMDGLSSLEHFMATMRARRGLIDIVARVGRAGSLMRKMVSASQDVIVTEEDCGTTDGIAMTTLASEEKFVRKIGGRISGRAAAEDVKHPETGEIMASEGIIISEDMAQKIEDAGVYEVKTRSPLTCETSYGVCAKCYGLDLATGAMAEPGAPVGMIAGTAVGEPATQLTMRVFYLSPTKADYIAAGLPTLDGLLEARESATIMVDGSPMLLRDILSQKGERFFRNLMLDELMKLYNRYGLNVNDKHFEILLSCMLSQVRITDPGDTKFCAGERVSKSQLRMENQRVDNQASAEPILMGLRETALSTESFLAATSFGDAVNCLTQAAVRGSRDELRGMRENLIVGRLIPAGTGFRKKG